ncbi:hypothetical protein [Desulfoferrobacter suflitae]|uniref:hypothetical protein n=1 Tax=Desulfoferrobacter suflitae TaxID=2865782 RepID=UPI002164EA58|nr:hypothetical protein [Desulfoferrobacter suflitae]MCK8602385.1 hypothetical protein [Desulfoferrobacter suflitae]
MKIASSTLRLSSAHTRVTREESQEKVRLWSRSASRTGAEELPARSPQAGHAATGDDRVTLSGNRPRRFSPGRHGANQAHSSEVRKSSECCHTDRRLLLLKSIVEAITGKKIHLADVRAWLDGPDAAPVQPQQAGSRSSQVDWGVTYSRTTSHYEYEEALFSARGSVLTADGQEITFSLNLQMSREFYHRESFSFAAGGTPVTDPLVLNFEGTAAELSNMTFAFDLDGDGRKEQVPLLSSGSGLLVFDRNCDGTINDGGELFGPSSGNGFKELAQFDRDGNLWIDENDPIFHRLAVWSRDEAGKDKLESLKDKGVGAISLVAVHTPFDLKDAAHNLQGQVRASGIYLEESGAVKSIQQIDLVG